MTITYALGTDVSFWQDANNTAKKIDFGKMKSSGASFTFIRAGQGFYEDEDFKDNWRNAKAAGILRGAYWFYDYRVYPEPQAEIFVKMLSEDKGDIYPVIDVEQVPNIPLPNKYAWLDVIQRFMTIVSTRLSTKTMVYLSPNIINYLSPLPSWLTSAPLWIAHWRATKPTCSPWADWTFWQYTDKGNGLQYGCESLNVDIDYFNGNVEQLMQKFGGSPVPDVPDEEKLKRLWQAHPELW